MKNELFFKVFRVIVKYVLPAVLGWLEGDSHAVQDLISSF